MVPQQNHLLNDWPIFGLQLMFNHIIGTKVPVRKSDTEISLASMFQL